MTVVYYVSIYYLDSALEIICLLKQQYDLHVVIEITPQSQKANIAEVDKQLIHFKLIDTGINVLGAEKWSLLEGYFKGVKSVYFLVHKSPKTFSFNSLFRAFKYGFYLNKIKPDIIHFDSITSRGLGMIPFIFYKKLFATIHDPVPHTGEKNWRENFARAIYFKFIKSYFFYSSFALNQFTANYKKVVKPKFLLTFTPFTYFAQFAKKSKREEYILFFGRISPYKGIDLLLQAIPLVLEQFPQEVFYIAGAPINNFQINQEIVKKYAKNIILHLKHVKTEELVTLIHNCKFVVCPYKDATQSGVLMTSFALHKVTVSSDVGAFSEYIADGYNGVLTKVDYKELALKIIEVLRNEKYKALEANLRNMKIEETQRKNMEIINKAYTTTK